MRYARIFADDHGKSAFEDTEGERRVSTPLTDDLSFAMFRTRAARRHITAR